MDKRYDHNSSEDSIYKLWEESGNFDPDKSASENKKPFCIIMPPPNANAPLHLGHAMFVAIEDMLIRYHRMLGDDTLWLPGTDHAGIETQFVYEKKLKKEGKSRFNFDRNTLYQKIWNHVEENSQLAISQMKKLGASADWSRTKFTLDSDIVNTVLETFKKLYDDNLIYRDLKLVNFCPKCGTAFSELEINHQEKNSSLYYLKYGPFTVATTRPETIFGDIAVAVNPSDERYQKYIDKEIEVDYLIEKRKIKVIADDYVDPEFGTGALKITPLHDHNDYELWQRHKSKLSQPNQVIDSNGRLNDHCGKYKGLKSHIAREEIAKDLEAAGLLAKETKTNYQNKVSTCYRCNTAIEPLPLPQFFIKVKPMIEKTLSALDKSEIKIHGAGHDKVLRHWLENLRDWNISRQITWGIRMPIWYDIKNPKNQDIELVFLNEKGEKKTGAVKTLQCNASTISTGLQNLRAPMGCEYIVSQKSPGANYLQETDTFDTWFSSGQWPFATLQNSKPGDFERFYPTSVMETAYDILPFWVMRMLMLGIHVTGKIPFKNVYFHGLLRDKKGQKMSKSKGNVVNPLQVQEKYGTDSLRMALIIRSSAGLDKSVGEADFKATRNFCNKLWNAARFVLMDHSEGDRDTRTDVSTQNKFDKKLKQTVSNVTKQLNDFKFGLATDTLYNEFWHWYCDECIELNKQGKLSQDKLIEGLTVFLRLLHPIIPFSTEAIWQELHKNNLVESGLLMTSPWPKK